MCVNRRVLVVEDRAAVRRLLRDTLADEGFEVHAAAEGAAALALLDRTAPPRVVARLAPSPRARPA